jgi:cardiolipin synthase
MKLIKFAVILYLLFLSGFLYSLPAEDVETINNADYFVKIDKILKDAKQSVYVIMFSMQYYDDYLNSPSNFLLKDLVDAKNRGVDVKVVIESGEGKKKTGLKQDKLVDNEKAVQYLKKNNVPYVLDSEDITTHSKLILIDGIYTVIGSTNWSYSALSKNNETSVLIKSSEVTKAYIDYFNNLFKLEVNIKK